jgi:hypothetical protein
MKKLLVSGTIASLLLPWLAFAATGDVTLDTSVVLSVNSITLNVSGSTATIESIEVGATSFTVTLQSGSVFQVTAGGLNQLSANNATWQSVNTCDSSASVLGYDVESEVIVTIAPSATLCADAAVATATSKGDSRGGGGGGTPAPQASPVAQLVTTTDFSSWTPAQKQAAIAQIRAALISLIQQLVVLIQQQIAAQTY